MITGINHITLAVTDLERSFSFYAEALGFTPIARSAKGAYLTAGGLWMALIISDNVERGPNEDYSHIAFSCTATDFAELKQRLETAGAPEWSSNQSEGNSHYFLDPDGHKLEIHVGDLATRLISMRAEPWEGLQFFSDPED